jgi:hypothetical protein
MLVNLYKDQTDVKQVDHFSSLRDSIVHYKYDMHCSPYKDLDGQLCEGTIVCDLNRQDIRDAVMVALQYRDSWQAQAKAEEVDLARLKRRVAIGTSLHDIALPSFEIDFDSQTFPCDWRGFVSELYSFETAFRTMQQKYPELINCTTSDESEWFDKAYITAQSDIPNPLPARIPSLLNQLFLSFLNSGRQNDYLWYLVYHRYYTEHPSSTGLNSVVLRQVSR